MYVVPHHLPLLLSVKELDSLLNVCCSPISSPSSSSSVGTGFITECMLLEMMGNHIHSEMNPVPTLEEEKGDDGEPHTFSNESSSYTGRRKGR
jgi:hypothetical protein